MIVIGKMTNELRLNLVNLWWLFSIYCSSQV